MRSIMIYPPHPHNCTIPCGYDCSEEGGFLMNTERLQRILQKLKEKNLSQMIISDPLAIYYLTGRLIDPGERLLALYISQSGNNRMIRIVNYNKKFHFRTDLPLLYLPPDTFLFPVYCFLRNSLSFYYTSL